MSETFAVTRPVIRLTASTRMFYPNENNGRDRYEAPGNWRRRLMKTKRERRQKDGVVKLTREKRGSRVAHDTLDGGRPIR